MYRFHLPLRLERMWHICQRLSRIFSTAIPTHLMLNAPNTKQSRPWPRTFAQVRRQKDIYEQSDLSTFFFFPSLPARCNDKADDKKKYIVVFGAGTINTCNRDRTLAPHLELLEELKRLPNAEVVLLHEALTSKVGGRGGGGGRENKYINQSLELCECLSFFLSFFLFLSSS